MARARGSPSIRRASRSGPAVSRRCAPSTRPGVNYRPPTPLPLTSGQVVSIIPQDLRDTLQRHPQSPVYVVGGGKTGMDTVLETLSEDPAREITLINGRGTNFINRTRYLPAGAKRWVAGELVSHLFRALALAFDGDNEEELIRHFRRHHSTDPETPNGVFFYGLQSEDEHAWISSGLSRIVGDYLADVTEEGGPPHMTLRSGTTQAVEAGSIFVNCTGSIFPATETTEYRPCLSPNDAVMSIGPRTGFTS
jgi:hypothetical protein